ncbi:uncharacterized protein LOC124372177 [Homalodisca vitripennis]|uniref:uncharacterized protein LOC124372177 n=1 Tax=Homalodisca vitripennis TaxID=197043 RepID=UPI001EEBA086|nr:uncharacterized protein LOC124372177 [Homalodisca vitripennis]
MAHRYIFEMIDRSLRDLMNSSVPFGNKIFICSGDFRQMAPVVEKARTPADVACVSLRASHLWRLFTLFSLTTPQRTSGSIDYSNFLLGVGNGTIKSFTFWRRPRERVSLIPLTGVRCLTSLADLITDAFPPGVLRDPDLCARRAILSTLNVNVKEINGRILDLMDGRIHELRSADTVDREDDDGLDVDVNLLNQATGKGVPVSRPASQGSRLPKDRRSGFVAVSSPSCWRYCMTGHKSQGQTIEYVGVDLRTDCFTHGQLYVLLSRVRRPDDIVVLVPDDRIVEGVAYAKNIVYDELLLNTD